MPLPIAHGFFGASLIAGIIKKPFEFRSLFPLFIGAFLANLPDLDFILVFATGDERWHRGFTHSIAFAAFVGLVIFAWFGRERWRAALAYSAAFASHFILDFVTTKVGGGLELFFPFSDERYGLRWFGLSEFPSRMSFEGIVRALSIELLIFFSLLILVIGLKKIIFESKGRLR